jgi:hypothetical protein
MILKMNSIAEERFVERASDHQSMMKIVLDRIAATRATGGYLLPQPAIPG